MKKWLTSEEAAQQLNGPISASTLEEYPQLSQESITAEERFAQLGLLFDRDRWISGEDAYLQLIQPKQVSRTDIESICDFDEPTNALQAKDKLSNDLQDKGELNDDLQAKEEENEPIEQTATDEKGEAAISPEPYDFARCTVRLVITLLPLSDSNSDRQCLLAASTHEDFPLAEIVSLSDLQPLPQPILTLLDRLEADLPNRRFRANVRKAKTDKTPKSRSISSTASQNQTDKSTAHQPTQINLFGL